MPHGTTIANDGGVQQSSTGQARPFFVIGAQRSGTTLLRLLLNAHSRLCVPFESGFIPHLYYRLSEFGDLREPANLRRLLTEIGAHRFVLKGQLLPDPISVEQTHPTTYAEVIGSMYQILADRSGKVRWGDKTPSYVYHMDILWRLFPNAQFIHLVRDGRDVALSLQRVTWGSKHLPRSALDWRRKVELAHKMGKMIPANFLEVKYEELVQFPDVTLTRVCEFIGEKFELPMLRHFDSAADLMPQDSLRWHGSSIKQIDPGKACEWKRKMSIADRIIFEDLAGDALELFGYELERRPATFLSRLRNLLYRLRSG